MNLWNTIRVFLNIKVLIIFWACVLFYIYYFFVTRLAYWTLICFTIWCKGARLWTLYLLNRITIRIRNEWSIQNILIVWILLTLLFVHLIIHYQSLLDIKWLRTVCKLSDSRKANLTISIFIVLSNINSLMIELSLLLLLLVLIHYFANVRYGYLA